MEDPESSGSAGTCACELHLNSPCRRGFALLVGISSMVDCGTFQLLVPVRGCGIVLVHAMQARSFTSTVTVSFLVGFFACLRSRTFYAIMVLPATSSTSATASSSGTPSCHNYGSIAVVRQYMACVTLGKD
jgi:hypothetical protein